MIRGIKNPSQQLKPYKNPFKIDEINYTKSNQDKAINIEKLITAVSNTQNNDSSLKSLTNIEEIRDFMEYTENCLKLISTLEKPSEFDIEDLKLELPEYMTTKKKLAIFDLDETLVHCELKNIKEAEKIISIKLPNGGKEKV